MQHIFKMEKKNDSEKHGENVQCFDADLYW